MEERYFIYLASFGKILKVGISREHRLQQRLVEQGADFGAAISKIRDGRLVRVYEQKIKRFLGITDRMSGEDKHRCFGKLDPSYSMNLLLSASERLKSSPFSEIFVEPNIMDMRKYYNLVDAETNFIQICKSVKLSGKVVSVKGNLAIVENGTHSCFNCHHLVGMEIISA